MSMKLRNMRSIFCMLLLATVLAGCEHFRHKQATLPVSIATVSNPDVSGLCEVLGKIAREHGLTAQPRTKDNVLCYFKREFHGFPLVLGARIDNDLALVDVWSWNIV